jgi:hypothetical protein
MTLGLEAERKLVNQSELMIGMQEGGSSVSCFLSILYIGWWHINHLQNDDMSRLYVKMSLWIYTRRCKVLLELLDGHGDISQFLNPRPGV